jgi:NADH-quinone oxidoreductase subunit E
MSSYFPKELKETIEQYLTRYETKRSSILPILHAIQDYKDWISDADVEALQKEFDLSAVDVREVLSFYSMYRKTPPKPYRFEICKSISCYLMKAHETIDAVKKRLEDAKEKGNPLPFECHAVECLGQCGYAPAALVNKDRHLNVTPERAHELIDEYLKKELPIAAKRCQEEAHSQN